MTNTDWLCYSEILNYFFIFNWRYASGMFYQKIYRHLWHLAYNIQQNDFQHSYTQQNDNQQNVKKMFLQNAKLTYR
jgi:hypothetical protein